MISSTIIVAFGGVSPEHEVSVISGIQAAQTLKESGQQVMPLYISKQGVWYSGEKLLDLKNYKNLNALPTIANLCRFVISQNGSTEFELIESGLFKKNSFFSIKCVVCVFHGSEGENGAFQGLCEQMNIAYTGSPVMASAIGMDKDTAKRLCHDAGIPTVPGISFWESEWVSKRNEILEQLNEIGYPVFVKPARLGSSIGVEKAENPEKLLEAIETAFRYDSKLIVEKAIFPLREINCSVLGTPEECRPSVCEQPKGSSEILSFKDKYQSDAGSAKGGMASASRIIPAPISFEKTKEIQQLATKIFRLLGCAGVSRLDFLMNDKTEEVYFNEINTIPGSLSFYLWEKSGLSFSGLLNELINIGVQLNRQKNGRIRSYETNLLQEKSTKGLKGIKGLK